MEPEKVKETPIEKLEEGGKIFSRYAIVGLIVIIIVGVAGIVASWAGFSNVDYSTFKTTKELFHPTALASFLTILFGTFAIVALIIMVAKTSHNIGLIFHEKHELLRNAGETKLIDQIKRLRILPVITTGIICGVIIFGMVQTAQAVLSLDSITPQSMYGLIASGQWVTIAGLITAFVIIGYITTRLNSLYEIIYNKFPSKLKKI